MLIDIVEVPPAIAFAKNTKVAEPPAGMFVGLFESAVTAQLVVLVLCADTATAIAAGPFCTTIEISSPFPTYVVVPGQVADCWSVDTVQVAPPIVADSMTAETV